MSFRKLQIKLGIVDDHNLFRKGLITLINLADRNNYIVVFEAESGKDLMTKLDRKILPDIILMDIDMPDMDGFETVAWLQQHFPDISILVISMIEKEEAIVRMLKLGVKGYLSKDIEVEDIHEALKAISNKGYYYTDFITGKLIDSLRNEEKRGNLKEQNPLENLIWKQLNENERKFMGLACTELTYEQIATEMFLSPKQLMVTEIISSQGLKLKQGRLVLFAIKNGLIKI